MLSRDLGLGTYVNITLRYGTRCPVTPKGSLANKLNVYPDLK